MSLNMALSFIKRQIEQIRIGGPIIILKKMRRLFRILVSAPSYIMAIPIVIIIRLISPFFLVRIGGLISCRIGHLAANVELYLCEKEAGINVPNKPHYDIFYVRYKPICNHQLLEMWSRILHIWPAFICRPVDDINQLIPGGVSYQIGNNSQNDRDIHNLLSQQGSHIYFSQEEEAIGESGLRSLGIPRGAKYVCLIVRDSAYLAGHIPEADFSYHNYRDTDIRNYALAAEELASRGFFVIRMGVLVNAKFECNSERVIDYATNGMRSDFMDIYLGAKCVFCLSVGTGFDAIPLIFRRPIAYINMVPVGYFVSFCKDFLGVFKHHIDLYTGRKMALSEIIDRNLMFAYQAIGFQNKNVGLVDNSPEEIRDLAIEMVDRLNGSWLENDLDRQLQKKFWELFPVNAKDARGVNLHGKIYSRCGAQFLRDNQWWLQ